MDYRFHSHDGLPKCSDAVYRQGGVRFLGWHRVGDCASVPERDCAQGDQGQSSELATMGYHLGYLDVSLTPSTLSFFLSVFPFLSFGDSLS